MKNALFIITLFFALSAAQAQDTTEVKVLKKNIVTVSEEPRRTEVSILNDKINIQDNFNSDTTNIRIGRRTIEIIEGHSKTWVNINKDDNDEHRMRWCNDSKPFNGHWAGFELGVNGFANADYSMYPTGTDDFMDLKQANSIEVNLNVLEWNIALKRQRIGLVSGLGFQWNNYKFDNAVTIDKTDDRLIQPIPIEENNFKKSKLLVTYLTVPLMLEFQIPVNDHASKLFVAGGMVGALNLGSHTKIKNDSSKDKDRGSFNIEPFKYSAIAKVGGKNFSVYATYAFSNLFKDGRGPELNPFSIGITLVNF